VKYYGKQDLFYFRCKNIAYRVFPIQKRFGELSMRTEYLLITFSDNDFYYEMHSLGKIVMDKFKNKEFTTQNLSNLIYVFPNIIAGLNLLKFPAFECEKMFNNVRQYIIDHFVCISNKEEIFNFIKSKLLDYEKDNSVVEFVQKEGGYLYWIHELQHINCNAEILLFQFSWDDSGNPKSSVSGFCII